MPEFDDMAAAFETLFCVPDKNGEMVAPDKPPIRLVCAFIRGNEATAANCVNAMHSAHAERTLLDDICRSIFDRFAINGISTARLNAATPDAETVFWMDNAMIMLVGMKKKSAALKKRAGRRIIPGALDAFDDFPDGSDDAETRKLALRIAAADRFSESRAFRYSNGELVPVEPDSVKPLNEFYGFHSVRSNIRDHLRDFALGKGNVPLLLHSLPGYGKTSMTTSYALEDSCNTLVLAGPDALCDSLENLVSMLSTRPDRRFVVFFDDIDPNDVNWQVFRTNVGGAFSLPRHILPVLSSNFEFPASILSRGRSVTFPVFDELRCGEMIEDFLLNFGLKRPPSSLISLIGADYTEAFGQKKFTELSPRTLTRHLTVFQDARKRKTLVEMADGPMITKPDPELFYAFNIRLMRKLYGDAYIDRLREEKLRNL